MIGFWTVIAFLVGIALWFVVRPLLSRRSDASARRSEMNIAVYRDQLRDLDTELANGLLTPEQHDKARRELEGRLLEDVESGEGAPAPVRPSRVTALVLGTVVPTGALAIYLIVGTPDALDPRVLADNTAAHAVDRQQLEAMVERLAARLKEDPESGEGWVMLAKSYNHFGRFEESARAYANAVSRVPPDATLLADYADVLAMAQGQRLQGEPEKLIARALEIDPRHLKALALAGTAAFERKNYAAAVGYWERMLPLVEPGSEAARAIRTNVDEARGLGGITVAAARPAVAPEPKQAASAAVSQSGVSGVVKLAPQLAGKVAPTDTVLIYARAAEGSRMPLAIVRKQARELPTAFTLDDTMAMTAGMTLSKQQQVVIAARISKSSNAAAQPGDFEGVTGPVRNNASGVTLVIDSEVR